MRGSERSDRLLGRDGADEGRLLWLIRASWLIGGTRMHLINRRTRINHNLWRAKGLRPGFKRVTLTIPVPLRSGYLAPRTP